MTGPAPEGEDWCFSAWLSAMEQRDRVTGRRRDPVSQANGASPSRLAETCRRARFIGQARRGRRSAYLAAARKLDGPHERGAGAGNDEINVFGVMISGSKTNMRAADRCITRPLVTRHSRKIRPAVHCSA